MSIAINESITSADAIRPPLPAFAVGDVVEIDGEPGVSYEIRAIDFRFVWLLSPIDGFETAEISELKRLDPSHQLPL